jgi:hypothetical protein
MYQLGDIKNLDSLYTLDPGAVTDALRLKDAAFQQSEQDLQKSRLANMFDEQRNPYLVEQAKLAKQQLGYQLPGIKAESSMRQRKDQMEEATYDDALKAARTKFIKEASDNDMDMLKNHVQKLMWSKNPQEQSEGVRLARLTYEMEKEREQRKGQVAGHIAGIRAQGEETRKTHQLDIDAGKFRHAGRAVQNDLEKALSSGSFDKASVAYNRKAELLAQEGASQEEIQYALGMAQYYADLWRNKPAQAKEGSVDITAMTKGEVPTKQVEASPRPTLPSRGTGRFPDNREQVRQDLQQGAQFAGPGVEEAVRAYAGQAKPQSPEQQTYMKSLGFSSIEDARQKAKAKIQANPQNRDAYLQVLQRAGIPTEGL